ncbi:hypothetical protein [Actinomycetospora straminea]|uniref:hypothetical protein n=1 Tax=Actinomycetospora straminea TaxID=663607 RepID=UPI0023664B80|nr:hypothetical protein [Actinomycetospora straminea]MDD7934626.1 hypothetical protein [Actinomycetospora straminea]
MTEQAGAQRTEGGTDTDTDDTSAEASADRSSEESGGSSSGEGRQSAEGSSGSSGGSGRSGSGSGPDSGSDSSPNSGAGGSSGGSSDDPPPSDAPTTQTRTPVREDHDEPRGRSERAPVNVGELVWKVAAVLASVVRVIGYVIAVVLAAYVLLTLVGVNPQNAVAQVIGAIADATVLSFRDLFLLADPTFAIVVNYGMAAVFWVLVAEFGSRLIRWLGARLS